MATKHALVRLSAAWEQSPSVVQDGVPLADVRRIHRYGIHAAAVVAKSLGLPVSTLSTACHLYHALFAAYSLRNTSAISGVLASILLASKVENTPRKAKDIIAASTKALPEVFPDSYLMEMAHISEEELRDRVVKLELYVCEAVSFNLYFDAAVNYVITFGRSMPVSQEVGRLAWNLVLDSFYLPLSLAYDAAVIAGACLYLAMLVQDHIPVYWWRQLLSPREVGCIDDICREFLKLRDDCATDRLPLRALGTVLGRLKNIPRLRLKPVDAPPLMSAALDIGVAPTNVAASVPLPSRKRPASPVGPAPPKRAHVEEKPVAAKPSSPSKSSTFSKPSSPSKQSGSRGPASPPKPSSSSARSERPRSRSRDRSRRKSPSSLSRHASASASSASSSRSSNSSRRRSPERPSRGRSPERRQYRRRRRSSSRSRSSSSRSSRSSSYSRSSSSSSYSRSPSSSSSSSSRSRSRDRGRRRSSRSRERRRTPERRTSRSRPSPRRRSSGASNRRR